MEKSNIVNIEIAAFNIQLYSSATIELEEGYEPFINYDADANIDISIECIAGIPSDAFSGSELVFEAKNEQQRFYSIYRTEKGLGFIIYNQQQINTIQQIAILDETFTQWLVYSEALPNKHILPLKYPLGPIVMHYLTLKSEAVMMHASCAFDGKKARVFTGFSGNGKSTMSKIWADAGSQIINDDRLIIRKQKNEFVVYNTPMYYRDISKKANLSAIYLISHSPENKIKKLSGALAITKVMAFCIQNNFEKQFIQSRLNMFSDMCAQIPVYDLGFVPNQSVIPFVINNEI